MRSPSIPRWLRAAWLPVLLATLLAALAVLQLQWIAEVSAAEKERFARSIGLAARDVAHDLDVEIDGLFAAFWGASRSELPSRLAAWRRDPRDIDLLAEAYVLESVPQRDRTPGTARITISLLNEDGSQTPVDAPALAATELRAALLPRLNRLLRTYGDRGAVRAPPLWILPELPALLLPIPDAATPGASFLRRPPGRALGAAADERSAFLLLVIDRQSVTQRLLPQLTAHHFADIGIDFELALVSAESAGVGPRREQEILWATHPDPRRWIASPDAAFECLRLDPRSALRQALGEASDSRDPDSRGRRPDRAQGGLGPIDGGAPGGGPGADRSAWRLLVHRPEGALERAVAGLTRRNLLLGGMILALLAGSMTLVLANGRRAGLIARRQTELVAGVTHELHTPLAAIAAAGDNLADGVVTDSDQVRRYGELIRREGRRLREMVAQTLTLAGLESSAAPLELQPVDLRTVLDEVELEARLIARDRNDSFREMGKEVLLAFPEGPLPRALGEPAAVRRVVSNLVHNAIKYGGGKVWVTVDKAAKGVTLTVEDDGPGIEREERSQLFEPFFRGRAAREQRAEGAGIGLYLARRLSTAMGASLEASNGTRGARFTLTLRPSDTLHPSDPLRPAVDTVPESRA